MSEKLVIMATHGPEEPELATIPFVMGLAALASDVDVVMGFQADGVRLVERGQAEKVEAEEFPALADLLCDYVDLGGKLLACSPCLNSRHLTQEALLDDVEVVAAGRLIAEMTSATNSLVY